MTAVAIRFEQAVYGTFPFWDKGYAILASSPGCRDEWLADLRAVCQRYGERPPDAAEAGGLLTLRLESGPWAIIGPCPQGADDRGRPGALAFHALFLSGSDYRKAGAFPFAFAGLLCKDWTAETTLESGVFQLDTVPPADPSPAQDPRASRIAYALAKGRRVAIEAPGPIDDLARQVWQALPIRRRRKLSLATWTFANGNHYDLAALPRLSGVTLDKTYVDSETFRHPSEIKPENREVYQTTEPPPQPTSQGKTGRKRGRATPDLKSPPPLRGRVRVGGRIKETLRSIELRSHPILISLAAIGIAILACVIIALSLHTREVPKPPVTIISPKPPVDSSPPRPAESKPFRSERVGEGLLSLAERFGTLREALTATKRSPDALMMRLRERLSYNGPFLTQENLSRIESSTDPDRARVLAWHAHILLFRPGRPLPSDFARGPLDWQVQTLAWSFYLDASNRPPEEVPQFLSDALSLPVSPRPTPLADRYPALGEYARFLRRLPAR